MPQPDATLKPGDWVLHKAGMFGQIKQVWKAGTWRATVDGDQGPAIDAEVIELQDGNVLLANDEQGPAFDVATEREAKFFQYVVVVLSNAIRACLPTAKAAGLDLGRTRLVIATALQNQLRELTQ